MLTKSIVKLIQKVAKKWQTDLALPFQKILPAEVVVTAAALEKVTFRERFFSPGSDSVGVSGSSLK